MDPGDPPPDPHAWDGADPIDRVVADLRAADRALARVLRQVAAASGRDGLSVRRQVALLAGATGSDVAFLERAVQVLATMPRTQQAFDEGALSWSQIRGIVLEARRLSVTQRAVLDDALAGTVIEGRDRGEPDRVVEICGDIAARLDMEGQERLEQSQQRTQRFGLQLDLPAVAQPPRTRAAQWAEALERMAAMALGGTTTEGTPRRARPRVSIIAPLSDLVDRDCDRLGSVTARLLLRRGNGRRRTSRALTRAIADDADLVAIFTDDDGIPAAIGDCYAPIAEAMRRAVAARDQGCRAPGRSAPIEHCDVHHVIPREEHGPTEVLNLVAMCRPCHTRITLHRWRMDLHPDGTLRTRIGRHTYVTRPRLPGTGQPGQDPDRRPAPIRPPNPPVARQTRRPDHSDQPVPF